MLTANLLVLILSVLDTGHEDGGLVGEDQAVLDEVLVTGIQDSVEHALVQQEVAHPLGDDDVDLIEGQLDLLHLALEQGDLVAHAVGLDNLLGLVDDGGHVDSDDMLGACTHGEPVVAHTGQRRWRGQERGTWRRGQSHMLRMEVPQPTSRTTLSLKRWPFW